MLEATTKPCRTPIKLRAAKAYIGDNHRHSDPPHAWLFGTSVTVDGVVVGVGVAARPCRELDDGYTISITRVCTAGYRNACSMIYGALVRAARALGYVRIFSYTKEDEDGASLKAAGFVVDHVVRAQGHDRPSRRRTTKPIDEEPKVCWRWDPSGGHGA